MSSHIQVREAFGEGHFYSLGVEVDGAEIAFGEGDEDFFGGDCAADGQQGYGAGGAVYGFDLADEDGGVCLGDVIEGAAYQVGYVDFVFVERGAVGAGNGDGEADEGFGGGDGVDSCEVKDDAAFMEPVGD
jgi:hypothetical protein